MISFLLFLRLISATPLPEVQHDSPNTIHAASQDTLYWMPSIVLTWADFQGTAPASNPFAAYTFTIVTLEYNATISGNIVKPTFKIRAAFNRKKSWVHDEPKSRTAVILAHEKAHFDIAEITARKLRKTFASKTFQRSTYKSEIDSIYDRIIKEGEEMQDSYDRETDHSRISAAQERWLTFVKKELEALYLYK